MSTILGLGLIIVSIYFLGQNIIFTTQNYYDWGHKISATGSVLCISAGVGALTFWRQQMGQFGWVLVAIGIVLVFLSGGVILRPTSLWTFFVAMLSFASGYQLLTKGRMRF
jgi:hypothetical protein